MCGRKQIVFLQMNQVIWLYQMGKSKSKRWPLTAWIATTRHGTTRQSATCVTDRWMDGWIEDGHHKSATNDDDVDVDYRDIEIVVVVVAYSRDSGGGDGDSDVDGDCGDASSNNIIINVQGACFKRAMEYREPEADSRRTTSQQIAGWISREASACSRASRMSNLATPRQLIAPATNLFAREPVYLVS